MTSRHPYFRQDFYFPMLFFSRVSRATPLHSTPLPSSLPTCSDSASDVSPSRLCLHVKTDGNPFHPPTHYHHPPRIFLSPSHARRPPTFSFPSLPLFLFPPLYCIISSLCSLLQPAISNASITSPCLMKAIRQRAPSSLRKMT